MELEEFAQALRLAGNDFGAEILELIDIQKNAEEPYYALCEELTYRAPEELKNDPVKAAERLIDRSDMLEEIETMLSDAGKDGDVDEVVRALLESMAEDEPYAL